MHSSLQTIRCNPIAEDLLEELGVITASVSSSCVVCNFRSDFNLSAPRIAIRQLGQSPDLKAHLEAQICGDTKCSCGASRNIEVNFNPDILFFLLRAPSVSKSDLPLYIQVWFLHQIFSTNIQCILKRAFLYKVFWLNFRLLYFRLGKESTPSEECCWDWSFFPPVTTHVLRFDSTDVEWNSTMETKMMLKFAAPEGSFSRTFSWFSLLSKWTQPIICVIQAFNICCIRKKCFLFLKALVNSW